MQSLLLTGLLSLLGQVVLLRELNVAFFGVELVYLLAIGVWMLGTALGSVLWPRGGGRPVLALGWVTLSAGLVLPLDVAFIRASRIVFGGVPGAFLSFPQQLATMVLALVPVSALLGLLFQWSARAYVSGRRTLAAAYGIESAGGVLGGLAATLLLRWGVQNFALAVGCALVAAVAVLMTGRCAWQVRRVGCVFRSAGTLLLIAALCSLVRSGPIDRAMTGWNHPALLATRDSPYGRITVTRADGQLSVFENDRLAFETQGTTAEEFVHLAAIQRPAVRRVLVLGGGPEGLVREILKHRPVHVDAVELDRMTFETIVAGVPEATRMSMRAPAVRVSFADPRRFLRTSGRYDLILIAMGEPDSGQTNRFYTREFFDACAARLTADGILGFRLASAENLWTPLLTGRMVSIHRALGAVFRDTVTLPGPTSLVLASRVRLPRDPGELSARFLERHLGSRLVSPPFIRYLYTNDRRAEIERVLAQGRAPMNTDVRPVCYQYAAMLWLAKFFPQLGTRDLAAGLARAPIGTRAWAGGLAVIALAAFFLAARRAAPVRRVLLAGTAGMAGMVLETVLLLHYQSRSGVLYQDVGLLLTSFMGGLAAGALVMARFTAGAALSAAPSMLRRVGYGLVAATALFAWHVAGRAGLTAAASLVETSALLAGSGALVAATFAYASLRGVADQQRVISPLYAADLAGGAAGAVLGTLVLIPLAGLGASSLAVAVLAVTAALLI